MQNWDYKVLTFSAADVEAKPGHMADPLSKEGSKGWEVISVVPIVGPIQSRTAGSEGLAVTRTLVVTLKKPRS